MTKNKAPSEEPRLVIMSKDVDLNQKVGLDVTGGRDGIMIRVVGADKNYHMLVIEPSLIKKMGTQFGW